MALMYSMSFPLQTKLLSSFIWRFPEKPSLHHYSPWDRDCGRGGGCRDKSRPSAVQPGQHGGPGLHVELGAASSVQSGWGHSAGTGGGRGPEGSLVRTMREKKYCFREKGGMPIVERGMTSRLSKERKFQKNGKGLVWLDCSAAKKWTTEARWHHLCATNLHPALNLWTLLSEQTANRPVSALRYL